MELRTAYAKPGMITIMKRFWNSIKPDDVLIKRNTFLKVFYMQELCD